MNLHYLKHTTAASFTALTLLLAAAATSSAQAPSYPIGQGPFGQPGQQAQQTQQPQAPTPPAARPPAATNWGQPQPVTSQQASTAAGAGTVQVANPEADAFSLQRLAGKPLRGSGQEELGSVSDFLIDPQTGHVRYAVVPSGAGASGETYRLIPMAALDPTSGPEGLRISLGKAQWNQVGTMTEQEIKGSISLNDEQRRRLTQQFAISQQPSQGGSNDLVRASQLRAKTLLSGGQQLGSIQDVAVDVRHRVAVAVVTAMGAAGPKFLVPFTQLQISNPEQSSVNTTLTQMHFQQAQSGTPTGLTGSPFTSANPPATSAAMAVRRALDQDSSLARAQVQVIPESRIALRGTVESEQIRSNIERTAKEVAPGLQVDNHITVKSP